MGIKLQVTANATGSRHDIQRVGRYRMRCEKFSLYRYPGTTPHHFQTTFPHQGSASWVPSNVRIVCSRRPLAIPCDRANLSERV
jgi:hypothetical protein